MSEVAIVSNMGFEQPTFTTLTPMKPSQDLVMSSSTSSESQTPPLMTIMQQNFDDFDEDDMDLEPGDKSSGQSNDPCLICGGVAKGLHFQVNSCRACAAFFRRSTKSKLVYRCQRGTGRCDLTIKVKGKPLCRYCRMKKCQQVGMRIESEGIPSLESVNNSPFNSPSSDLSPIQRWTKNLDRSEVRIEGKRLIYNSQPLVALIKESLLQNRSTVPNLPAGVTLTSMQRMCNAVSKFLTSLQPKIGEIQVVTEIGADCGMRFQEEYLIKLTELVTSCNYFVNLPDCDKFPIFKRFWNVFQQIERGYQTIQVFGHEINDFRFLIDDKKAVDMDLNKFKIADFGKKDMDNVLKLFEPIRDCVFNHFLNPMKMTRPSMYELAFMTQHILWSCFEISGLTQPTYKIAEEIMERNANELHNYYVYEMHISTYAPRLAALLKQISVAEYIIRSKKDMMIMAKVFDVIENDFFESELMQ